MENFIHRLKVNLRKFFLSNKHAEAIANKILYLKVQSPFDKNQSIVMIDLLASTSMTERNILAVAQSYGIELPSQGVDISGQHALEYLLYHGKKFQYTTFSSDGERIIQGVDDLGFSEQILPLIPGTHLDKMVDLFSYSKETWNPFFGQAVEFAVKDKLIDLGYKVKMPSGRNEEGYDICVERKFFDDHGLPFIENPSLDNFGLLQIKSTSEAIPTKGFTSNTIQHFEKYPDIPVIASSKIVDSIPETLTNKVIAFNEISLDDNFVETQIHI